MKEFRFHAPVPVQFGVGVAQKVGEQAKRLGMRHAFLVTDPVLAPTEMVAQAQQSLSSAGLAVTLYSHVVADPDAPSIHRGADALKASDADGLIGLGGGSAMDSAKLFGVLAAGGGSILDYPVPGATRAVPSIAPLICMPTTSGTGSEVTPIAVVTDLAANMKKAVVSPAIAPSLALVDPTLTISMPPRLTASTGMDALSHAIETMTSVFANPISDTLAVAALELIGRYLVRAVEDGSDIEARSGMSLAALMAGQAFPSGLLHLGHAIGHALGTAYHIPHGLACAVALPAALEFARPAVEGPLAKAAHALAPGSQMTGPAAVADLYRRVGLPSLSEAISVTRADIPKLIDVTMREDRLIVRCPIKPTVEDWARIFEQSL